MTITKKIYLFFVLPTIACLLMPPNTLASGYLGILAIVILFVFLGYLLIFGKSRALTLAIFLVGLNSIVRLMMLFSHSTYTDGTANLTYIITSILSIALSIYLVLRLDQLDVRIGMK